MPEEATVQVPEEMEKVISYIEGLTLLEAKTLADTLKERLGVSDAMPMMMGGPMMAGAAAGPAEEEEEQTEFNVVLTAFGEKKIGVIKEVRAITGLGLKEAKALVESAPDATIKEAVSKEEAEEIKTKLEEAGGTVELK